MKFSNFLGATPPDPQFCFRFGLESAHPKVQCEATRSGLEAPEIGGVGGGDEGHKGTTLRNEGPGRGGGHGCSTFKLGKGIF
jgi:hypothetical protein